jgi:hypothetical protein
LQPAGLACKISACGDGYIDTLAGEACDDGNTASGDGCSGTSSATPCQVEPGFKCTTPGPSKCTGSCGDGVTNTAGGEACDDHNTSSCGTCDATCKTVQPLTAATGTIFNVQASSLHDGETFVLSDGAHKPITFEFNSGAGTKGHIVIAPGTSDAHGMAQKVVTAINGSGLSLTAVNPTTPNNSIRAVITNSTPGLLGNVQITETVADGGFTVSGMQGGLGGDCSAGVGCKSNDDCASTICTANVCAAATCSDTVQNGDETDTDCGGSCPSPCPNGQGCILNTDCHDGVCKAGSCAAASCSDQVKNGNETDTDCGGGTCPKCVDGKHCGSGTDCANGVCTGGVCQASSCTDNVRNGNETDTDCGGGTCQKCADNKHCVSGTDCADGVCTGGVCQAPTCSDNVKNGNETDTDCGGPTCQKCADNKHCGSGTDCADGVCTGGVCQAPTCSDGVQNGNETSIDCGGSPCGACAGASCNKDSDCHSNSCPAAVDGGPRVCQ